MKIVALDDSPLALKLLADAIAEVRPEAEVFSFDKPTELLAFTKDTVCDIAFLDIQMRGISGLSVARALTDLYPKLNIIFVTAHSGYASKAFDLHPSGYILKPVTTEAVAREIENLRYPISIKNSARVYAQTFGNFEIFVRGVPLKFKYSKTKEMLAYLIDRNGASSNMNELCAVLWEDKADSKNMKAYLRKLVSDLRHTLKAAGADDIVCKQHNSLAVIPEKITCDSYGFIKHDPECVNAYFGQYMAQYSWAEMSTGTFRKVLSK